MENRLQDLDDQALAKYMNRVIAKHDEAQAEVKRTPVGSPLRQAYEERIAGTKRLFTNAFTLAVERGMYVVH